jgi:hypothetical protein
MDWMTDESCFDCLLINGPISTLSRKTTFYLMAGVTLYEAKDD